MDDLCLRKPAKKLVQMVYIDRESNHTPSAAIKLSDLPKEDAQNTGQRTIRRAQRAKHPLLQFVFPKGLDPAPHPPKSTGDAMHTMQEAALQDTDDEETEQDI